MNITIRHHQQETKLTYSEPVLLSKALQDAALSFPMPCGGKGTCGKCAVQAAGSLSKPTAAEAHLPSGMRLACSTTALGDCVLTVKQTESTVLTDGVLPHFTKDLTQSGYGFAVDIGTTTIAVYLYRLDDAAFLGKTSFPNPQISFGADVISRIQAALDGQAMTLQAVLVSMIEEKAAVLCKTHHIDTTSIRTLAMTGNTTMLYLLTQTEVAPLSCAPFVITEYFGNARPASSCGFQQFAEAELYLSPTISAFVGSDITCAIQSSELCKAETVQLLVDIGTNGEMALWDGQQLYCCSTAAGPAFEGAGISCGMPAGPGAIDRAYAKDGQFHCTTIDEKPAIGICGSGLIDAVAAFLDLGCIDETGYIDEEAAEAAGVFTEWQEEPALLLSDGIQLTGRDIREVQLAKAAICAGMESLLHTSGHSLHEVSALLLAGGFGSFINGQSAARIGLIPTTLAVLATAIGNAAGMGAILALLSNSCKQEAATLAAQAEVLDLSSSAYFMDRYIEQMMF